MSNNELETLIQNWLTPHRVDIEGQTQFFPHWPSYEAAMIQKHPERYEGVSLIEDDSEPSPYRKYRFYTINQTTK